VNRILSDAELLLTSIPLVSLPGKGAERLMFLFLRLQIVPNVSALQMQGKLGTGTWWDGCSWSGQS